MSSVVRALTLSRDEQHGYRRLAASVLRDALQEYDVYARDGHTVNDYSWKHVKSQDGIHVYKERGVAKRDPALVPTLRTVDGRHEHVVSNISTPYVLATGSFPGTVEDVVYGAYVDSTESHRTRGWYIKDRSADFRVLAQLESRTEDAPFTFCGIGYTNMGEAGVPLVRRRDLVTLIASGMTTAIDGDTMGYYIIHSISHVQVPPLPKVTRAATSFVYLFRQVTRDHVEIFQKGFFAPRGDLPEGGVLAAVVRTLLTPSLLVDAAHGKKLRWMLMRAPPARQRTHDDDGSSDSGERRCGVGCERRRSDSFSSSKTSLGLDLLRRSQGPQGVCVVCKTPVCSTCKVVRKIVVDAAPSSVDGSDEDPVTVKSLGFCLACINKSKTTSAVVFARQELREQLQQVQPQPLSTPSSSQLRHLRRTRTLSNYSTSSTTPSSTRSTRSPETIDRRQQEPATPNSSKGIVLLPMDQLQSLRITKTPSRRDHERRAIDGLHQRGIQS